MAKRIALDLGVANTRFLFRGKSMILSRPTLGAADTVTGELLAVGESARAVIAKTPGAAYRALPLSADGVISCEMAADILYGMLESAEAHFDPKRYEVYLSLPTDADRADESDYYEIMNNIGFKRIRAVRVCHALAAAAGVEPGSEGTFFSVSVGDSRTELSLFRDGAFFRGESNYYAGGAFTAALTAYLKENDNVLASPETVEALIGRLGSAAAPDPASERRAEVICRNLSTGLPVGVTVTDREVYEALSPTLASLSDSVAAILETVPAEVLGDIFSAGISLSGGAAQLTALDQRLTEETGVAVRCAEEPAYCVIRGLGRIMNNPVLYEDVIKQI